MQHKFEIGP